VGKVSGQQPTLTSGSDDLNALLKRMEANMQANARFAARYTYDGTYEFRIYNNDGKLIHQASDKFASVTVNGIQYNRIIEEDGKPVSEEQQIAGQKRQEAMSELEKDYDFIFEMRGPHPHDDIRSGLPISYLGTLFDNHAIGHELINGRDNLVVLSTPKEDANPDSDPAKTALDWKEVTWIDVEDTMPTRYEVELQRDVKLLRDQGHLLKGGTFSREFARLPFTQPGKSQLPEIVWLLHSWNARLNYRTLWNTNTSVSHVDAYNYKRFQSDARVIENSVQEVPAPATGKQP
jgi:hypothetical protein